MLLPERLQSSGRWCPGRVSQTEKGWTTRSRVRVVFAGIARVAPPGRTLAPAETVLRFRPSPGRQPQLPEPGRPQTDCPAARSSCSKRLSGSATPRRTGTVPDVVQVVQPPEKPGRLVWKPGEADRLVPSLRSAARISGRRSDRVEARSVSSRGDTIFGERIRSRAPVLTLP